MARALRIAYPGALYHVTCRGNEQRAIFRDDHDRETFLSRLQVSLRNYQVHAHVYVLMDNHFHLVVETPQANLSAFMRHFNVSYAGYFNRRHKRVGHLYQGRFTAIVVEEDAYLLEVSRYVHLNPIRVGLVQDPAAYPWSSAAAHLAGRDDALVKVEPLLALVGNWKDFLLSGVTKEEIEGLRRHERTGRPLGNDGFVGQLEELLGRILQRRRPGRKKGQKQK